KAGERRLEPTGVGQAILLGDEHVLEDQLAGDRGAQRVLVLLLGSAEPLGPFLHQEAADLVVAGALVLELGPDDGEVGHGAVGDPHLGAVEDVAAVGARRARDHPARVGAVVGLGEPEAADDLALGHRRQPAAALLLGAVGVDRIHAQRTLHRDERAQPRIAALQLLHRQAVGGVADAGATVLLRQRRPQQPNLGHLGDHVGGEVAFLVRLLHHRQVAILHPFADVIADRPLLVAQQRVGTVEVDAAEAGHRGILTGCTCRNGTRDGRRRSIGDVRRAPKPRPANSRTPAEPRFMDHRILRSSTEAVTPTGFGASTEKSPALPGAGQPQGIEALPRAGNADPTGAWPPSGGGATVRIAQIAPLIESVPPRLYGGTERVVSHLTEELVRQGHEVTLFASADSVTRARLVPCCPRALRMDDMCVDRLAHQMVALEKVYRRAHEFDVFHFHIDYMHFPHSRRARIPNVTTLHGRLDLADLEVVY